MIVDTSAVLAILFAEPEAQRIADAIEDNPICRFPATCFLEATMTLLGRNGEDGLRDLDLFLAHSRMEIAPLTESQARLACEAFKRFGKGRHPAKLNFGDCISYALARETGEELLFKGTDFALTDIAVAAY
ncbi:MAG: type II toxin-antitoxin system VapC family toxin [Terracidiphilus sp.]|jgi:ribonuclease VapC